jgi:hypothetical protein
MIRRFSKRTGLQYYYFYDDFTGTNYEDRWWTTRGTGGSLALQTDGSIRVRATANNSFEMYQNDLPDFFVAKNATMMFRYKLNVTTSIQGEVGFEAASPNNTLDWVTLYYDSAVGSNWQAQAAAGGTSTTVDTGVAADANYHEFKIITRNGEITYYIDGVLVATITTNITSLALQPYAYIVSKTGSTRDVFFNWIEAVGERE